MPGLLLSSASTAGMQRVLPEYSAEQALSTLARFPWVWVCTNAVAWDLAGQPLVAVRRTGKQRDLVDDPALALLRNPSPGMTGTLLFAQLSLDRQVTGNAYLWVPGLAAWKAGTGPYPVLAIRLHPHHVELLTGKLGLISAFRYTDTSTPSFDVHVIPAGDVVFVRGTSWRNTAQSVLGESVVRCLHDDLVTNLAARELVAAQASSGRPDVFFSTTGPVDEKARKDILSRWVDAIRSGVGAMVVGNGVTATPIGWSPKDFPFESRDEKLRDTILALFEVTPQRAGLVTANYGTDRQQARTYWSSIVRKASEWSDAFSQLCAPGVRIEVDFSNVEALQVSYSERMARVQAWAALGANPNEAAAYEGFDEAPKMPATAAGSGASTAPRTESEDGYQGDRRSLELALEGYLRGAAERYTAAAGADASLLQRSETAILRAVLERGGVADAARWADELASITDEAVRSAGADASLLELRAFGADRARRIAVMVGAREAA
jgi:phage portal protein BeeE